MVSTLQTDNCVREGKNQVMAKLSAMGIISHRPPIWKQLFFQSDAIFFGVSVTLVEQSFLLRATKVGCQGSGASPICSAKWDTHMVQLTSAWAKLQRPSRSSPALKHLRMVSCEPGVGVLGLQF